MWTAIRGGSPCVDIFAATHPQRRILHQHLFQEGYSPEACELDVPANGSLRASLPRKRRTSGLSGLLLSPEHSGSVRRKALTSYPSPHSFTGTKAQPSIPSSIVGCVRVQFVAGRAAPAVVFLIRAVKQPSDELSVFIHGHIERHTAFGHYQQFF